FNGDFVKEDWPRAYALMTLANSAALPQAAQALVEMDRVISADQRRQAEVLADQMRAETVAQRNPTLVVTMPAVEQAPAPVPVAAPLAAPSPVTSPVPAVASAVDGPWRVQFGAFSVPSNADALWGRLADRSELAGMRRMTSKSGRLTFLQAGGFATREAAGTACTALKKAGFDCIVTDRLDFTASAGLIMQSIRINSTPLGIGVSRPHVCLYLQCDP